VQQFATRQILVLGKILLHYMYGLRASWLLKHLVKPVLKGHFGTKKKWPYKTGDLLKEVQFI
jgi:hypothetical protein